MNTSHLEASVNFKVHLHDIAPDRKFGSNFQSDLGLGSLTTHANTTGLATAAHASPRILV